MMFLYVLQHTRTYLCTYRFLRKDVSAQFLAAAMGDIEGIC